mmetsp:Transcript_65473/g.188676  ORF Transcript_65473/g.188676 Transcript_65473/m.188676 type:complete len:245 (+) Transcript_65473:610-1344(+)
MAHKLFATHFDGQLIAEKDRRHPLRDDHDAESAQGGQHTILRCQHPREETRRNDFDLVIVTFDQGLHFLRPEITPRQVEVQALHIQPQHAVILQNVVRRLGPDALVGGARGLAWRPDREAAAGDHAVSEEVLSGLLVEEGGDEHVCGPLQQDTIRLDHLTGQRQELPLREQRQKQHQVSAPVDLGRCLADGGSSEGVLDPPEDADGCEQEDAPDDANHDNSVDMRVLLQQVLLLDKCGGEHQKN